MPSELVTFNEGLSYDSRSALQSHGYLQTCNNIQFRKEGEQELRPAYGKYNSTAINSIKTVVRYKDKLIVNDSGGLRHIETGTPADFRAVYGAFTNTIFWCDSYKGQLHICNGTDNVLYDASGNIYPGVVVNPVDTPSVADAATDAWTTPTGYDLGDAVVVGGTTYYTCIVAHTSGVFATDLAAGKWYENDRLTDGGIYKYYITYLITWPYSVQYETGFSPASDDVTVTANRQVNITNIDVSDHTFVTAGMQLPTIHRKIYRGPGTDGTLADIYLVGTLTDPDTTTYSDIVSDTAVIANGASTVDDYIPMPTTAKFLKYHYSRLFCITTTNTNRLYHSEAPGGTTATANENLKPLAFKTNNWDDLRAAGVDVVDPQGIVTLGTDIYIPLKHTWIKKSGNTPSTWTYKKTFAMYGVAAPYTIAHVGKLKGVVSLSEAIGGVPALTLFNGYLSDPITNEQFSDLFEDDLNHDQLAVCQGAYDGRNYHLLYPSGAATIPDKHAVFDLSKFPKIRLAYWTGLSSQSIDVYNQGKRVYIAGSDGFCRYNGGTETITPSVKTHDLMGGDPSLANKWKMLKRLKYSLNGTMVLVITIDGTAITWADGDTSKSITGTGDAVQIMELPRDLGCYKYNIAITAAETDFDLYSPWEMEFDYVE